MPERADKLFIGAVAGFTLLGFSAIAFSLFERDNDFEIPPGPAPRVAPTPVTKALTAPAWFSQMRGYCNAVDVVTRLSANPAPEGMDGTKHEAACYALAGRVDLARSALLTLPPDEQWRGAGVVFDAGHPAADAGDDLAAGPLMELVVEFWPNHYMALYHAGAAAFERGEEGLALGYLTRFLEVYDIEDGFRKNALRMLADMG